MELSKMTKKELLVECERLGIKKSKSKRKEELIECIHHNYSIMNLQPPKAIAATTTVANISPLRYPGGKTRACKKMEEVLLQHFDIYDFNTIISPFFGGGSFEFYLQNRYGFKLIVNDKFTPLYHFWKQVKEDKEGLCEELRKKIHSVSKEQFTTYRNTIMGLNEDRLQQSIQYFILNRCSFSGSTLSGGFSEEASKKRFTPSSIDRIEALDFTNIEIYNKDFYDFLKHETNHRALMFLDPPYYLEKKIKTLWK